MSENTTSKAASLFGKKGEMVKKGNQPVVKGTSKKETNSSVPKPSNGFARKANVPRAARGR